MKLPVAVLAASLALNAGLFAALTLKPTLAPPAFHGFFSRIHPSDSPLAAAAPQRVEKTKSANRDVWTKLETADLRDLIARLRAAGFPADIIRAIVAAEIEVQFRPRMKELADRMWSKEFWKSDASNFMGYSKVMQDMNGLFRERSKLQRSLLGDEAFADAGDVSAELRRRFGDLPKAKIDLVKQVEDDYSDMTQQLRGAMQGITLPEDREKLALLQREKHADLAAILSPDELADYEMRTSNVTMRLRSALTIMDASEQEFRTIYDKTLPFKDVLYSEVGGGMNLDLMEKRRDAQAQLNDQLKTALGDARYADYLRANDRDYQSLYRLAKRDNIASDTVNQAYSLRDKVATESTRIFDDANLSAEDKRAALQTLAQNTRVQLNGLLGPTAGDAYAKSLNWLRSVENGSAFSLGPDGTPRMRTVRRTPPPRN